VSSCLVSSVFFSFFLIVGNLICISKNNSKTIIGIIIINPGIIPKNISSRGSSIHKLLIISEYPLYVKAFGQFINKSIVKIRFTTVNIGNSTYPKNFLNHQVISISNNLLL
jgi:hypothetical protein